MTEPRATYNVPKGGGSRRDGPVAGLAEHGFKQDKFNSTVCRFCYKPAADHEPKPDCAKCGDPEAAHGPLFCVSCMRMGRELTGYCDGYEPIMTTADLDKRMEPLRGVYLTASERRDTIDVMVRVGKGLEAYGRAFQAWVEEMQRTLQEAQRDLEARIAERRAVRERETQELIEAQDSPEYRQYVRERE